MIAVILYRAIFIGLQNRYLLSHGKDTMFCIQVSTDICYRMKSGF
jgi:hypothetical protein